MQSQKPSKHSSQVVRTPSPSPMHRRAPSPSLVKKKKKEKKEKKDHETTEKKVAGRRRQNESHRSSSKKIGSTSGKDRPRERSPSSARQSLALMQEMLQHLRSQSHAGHAAQRQEFGTRRKKRRKREKLMEEPSSKQDAKWTMSAKLEYFRSRHPNPSVWNHRQWVKYVRLECKKRGDADPHSDRVDTTHKDCQSNPDADPLVDRVATDFMPCRDADPCVDRVRRHRRKRGQGRKLKVKVSSICRPMLNWTEITGDDCDDAKTCECSVGGGREVCVGTHADSQPCEDRMSECQSIDTDPSVDRVATTYGILTEEVSEVMQQYAELLQASTSLIEIVHVELCLNASSLDPECKVVVRMLIDMRREQITNAASPESAAPMQRSSGTES